MNASSIAPLSDSPLDTTIAHLRRLTQVSVQSTWRYCDVDLEQDTALNPAIWDTWAIAPTNAKDHIAWARGRQVRWLSQVIPIPTDLAGYPLHGLQLRIALLWWAESAQVFVDGVLVQEGDLFDSATRLLLRPTVRAGDAVAIALRLVSPSHDDGALVKSRCVYESVYASVHESDYASISDISATLDSLDLLPDPGFIADELAVLQTYCRSFAPGQEALLVSAIAHLDWQQVHNRARFDQGLAQLRSALRPLSAWIKQRTIKLTGHAHLDMAWLWTVDETWEAAERTFASALTLQTDFPELIFCHSTPALYEWMEHHRPDLFQSIVQKIQAGQWEEIGGLWVEPELNLISGESIARHLLYGQRYFQEKFGRINRIAWLPDTFGFNWQLPQLLKQGGIDYFVTQKLRWNDTTQFPYDWFRWQAPDGTQLWSLMSAPIGEGIDPVKMAEHACAWETKTGLLEYLWLPGVGDHGGGPTRDMLTLVRRWQTSPFFPTLEFTSVVDYLDQIAHLTPLPFNGTDVDPNPLIQPGATSLRDRQVPDMPLTTSYDSPVLPVQPAAVWNSELYLEFHRGCYTTHGDQKQFNRTCEALLFEAELWSSLATIVTGADYPRAALETAWKQVLFNQFHDILPGTSIPQVFTDANQAWKAAQQAAIALKQQALTAIAQHLAFEEPPSPGAQAVVVFNPLPWERSPLVYAPTEPPTFEPDSGEIAWLAEDIPAIGYRRFWREPSLANQSDPADISAMPAPTSTPEAGEHFQIENEYLRIWVDPTTGDLSSLWDKTAHREVLSGPGNQLQAFRDQGQYWDAWNIDPHYADHPLPPAQLLEIRYGDRDLTSVPQLTESLEVRRQIGSSIFQQTYRLTAGVPYLEISTTVHWVESQVMVKVNFPLTLAAEAATYELSCGAIQRATLNSTVNSTAAHSAQWEVPALGWADLGDDTYGVSLLSDYKHGYDAQPSQLRLTLLRSSCWPNPHVDRGVHHFTYAIYPHRGSWQAAHTPRHSRTLSQSSRPSEQFLDWVRCSNSQGPLSAKGTFLDLGSDQLMLMAFKPAEDNPTEFILRCYECHGEATEISLTSDIGLQLSDRLDLLERPVVLDHPYRIGPWQVATFRVLSPLDGHTNLDSNGP